MDIKVTECESGDWIHLAVVRELSHMVIKTEIP
jgi:hypothetical protein